MVTKGRRSSLAAASPTQAGARERAWISSTPSCRQSSVSLRMFSAMASGFLAAAGKGSQTPPLAWSSATSRPPSVATSARAPTSVSPPAMSTAVRSAPPASSSGMICRIVRPTRGWDSVEGRERCAPG